MLGFREALFKGCLLEAILLVIIGSISKLRFIVSKKRNLMAALAVVPTASVVQPVQVLVNDESSCLDPYSPIWD